MPVKESHTITIEGNKITLTDLAALLQKAEAAGATANAQVKVKHTEGNQRDGSWSVLTVVIT